jgi:hypothetical protein
VSATATERAKKWQRAHPEEYTASMRRSRLKKRVWVDKQKFRPCADCGGTFPPECMDFDHVRGEKLFNLGQCSGRSIVALGAEIAKCDVVCANCHRIRTRRRKAT